MPSIVHCTLYRHPVLICTMQIFKSIVYYTLNIQTVSLRWFSVLLSFNIPVSKKHQISVGIDAKNVSNKNCFKMYRRLDCFVVFTLEWCCFKNEQIQLTTNRLPSYRSLTVYRLNHAVYNVYMRGMHYFIQRICNKVGITVSDSRAYTFFMIIMTLMNIILLEVPLLGKNCA